VDTEQEIFPAPIDRTPYGALWYVIILALTALIGGIILLWQTAGYVKSRHLLRLPEWPDIRKPVLPSVSKPEIGTSAASRTLKEAADSQTDRLINRGLDAAESQVRDAVGDATLQGLETLREEAASTTVP
jgi:hypothetical protein